MNYDQTGKLRRVEIERHRDIISNGAPRGPAKRDLRAMLADAARNTAALPADREDGKGERR